MAEIFLFDVITGNQPVMTPVSGRRDLHLVGIPEFKNVFVFTHFD